MTELAEMVPVEDVRQADVLRRPSGSLHQVHAVRHYPAAYGAPESFVVIYVAYDEASCNEQGFVIRATSARPRSWKPLKPGQRIPIVRRADG